MAKGKQKAADEAYHRAEVQRALVMVLACAERTHEAGIADAAALLRTHFLKVSEPPKVKTLAGQLDIDGSVEGAPHDPEVVRRGPMRGVPQTCARCGTAMLIAYGGSWTALHLDFDDHGQPLPENTPMLQCGHCGYLIIVDLGAWFAVRDERRRTIGGSDAAPVKAERRKKERGAG